MEAGAVQVFFLPWARGRACPTRRKRQPGAPCGEEPPLVRSPVGY